MYGKISSEWKMKGSDRTMKKICRLMCFCCLWALLLGISPAQAGSFTLPSGLISIDAEAFMNVPIQRLVIPEGTERIETRAFAGCGIKSVVLPKSLTYLAPDAFGVVGDLWVKATSGSYAESWAKENDAILVKGLGVKSRTQSQIKAFIAQHPADTTSVVSFRQNPEGGHYSDAPYHPGLISEKSITDGINMINQMRYIAGLNADVIHDSERELVQGAAALVNALNGGTSHYPERPEELSDSIYDDLYDMACIGGSSSNLYAGKSNLADAVVGYIMDPGESNLKTVGHRRWILNPSMGKTTFGYYYSPDVQWKHYSNMYAFDRTGSGRETLVAWPAQQTPMTHYIRSSEQAWSLSFGRVLDENAISVSLVRERDGKVWSFAVGASDGAFYVNNDSYGLKGCVIFLPEGLGSIKAGDEFLVSVEDREARIVVQYTVTFFNP